MVHTKLHHKADCRRSDAERVEGAKGIVLWKCPDCGAVASTPQSV
jgi:uncharacterized C2H2 Zn-finger protein